MLEINRVGRCIIFSSTSTPSEARTTISATYFISPSLFPRQNTLFAAPTNNPIIHPTPAKKTALLACALAALVFVMYNTLYTALETTYAILNPFKKLVDRCAIFPATTAVAKREMFSIPLAWADSARRMVSLHSISYRSLGLLCWVWEQGLGEGFGWNEPFVALSIL